MFSKKTILGAGGAVLFVLGIIGAHWWARESLARAARPQIVDWVRADVANRYRERPGPRNEIDPLRIDLHPDLIVTPSWLRTEGDRGIRHADVEATAITGGGDIFFYRMRFVYRGRWQLETGYPIRGS